MIVVEAAISINCRISAGKFQENVSCTVDQRLRVVEAKMVVVETSSYEHKEFVAADDILLKMGDTVLGDEETLEEEGVEEDAMLTMAVDGVMNKIYE